MVWMIFTFLFRDWCSDSLSRPWRSTSGPCCVLANGQSSCEGSQAPHGSDRRFLRDECQFSSGHGVRGNLDLHLSLPFSSGLGVIGGVGSLSTDVERSHGTNPRREGTDHPNHSFPTTPPSQQPINEVYLTPLSRDSRRTPEESPRRGSPNLPDHPKEQPQGPVSQGVDGAVARRPRSTS